MLFRSWPNFVFRRVRALAVLGVLGLAVVASSLLSGYGVSGVPSSAMVAATTIVAILINLALFLVAFQLLTAIRLRWRDLVPGAVCAAVGWTVLQTVGGYYVSHELRAASNVYGTFALVIALLVWISLGAQLTLISAEINVVRAKHLWPRSLVQPPINEADERVYKAIAERSRMRPEVGVDVTFREGDGDERAEEPDPSEVSATRGR